MYAYAKTVDQGFQPVEVSLVFESKEELLMLCRMMKMDVDIPEMMSKRWDYSIDNVQHLMDVIHTETSNGLRMNKVKPS
jgi:hypothetical protein